eukprot:TRINITY_DN6399_c1_g1_i5.p1 TRINITY_DN6399_c1_g1~~TRINITY_DN6399_c1_g1_i5.p1  ORF type:complete len:287 (-),score=13.14 TRINITY_DN6399_c1_g1_i5:316-1176(-)
MLAKNEQNNQNLANCQFKPNLINKHCKHCLSCLIKGIAQKKELEGAIENAKWLNNIETAELYITRARQADAIQRMLGVQPGPWGVPNRDVESNLRARRNLCPLQVCIPLQYTNIKQTQGRITLYPDVVLIPKWSVASPDKRSISLQSKIKHKYKKNNFRNESNPNKMGTGYPSSKGGVKNQQLEFSGFSESRQCRKSPVLSPGQFIHFTWLSICKVAAGMKRKLTPSKQASVDEPIRKIPSFSELNMQNKPCRPSREMITYKLVDCERAKSSFSEESVETVTAAVF